MHTGMGWWRCMHRHEVAERRVSMGWWRCMGGKRARRLDLRLLRKAGATAHSHPLDGAEELEVLLARQGIIEEIVLWADATHTADCCRTRCAQSINHPLDQ